MKLKTLLIGSVMTASIISLSACSTWGKHGNNSGAANANQAGQMAGDNDNSAAKTQGYGAGQNGFGSVNPMCQVAVAQGGTSQHYFFDFNKNNIRSQYKNSLETQANYLLANSDQQVKITGNTDDRGSREYNVALGWRRAKAIAAVLEQDGVKASQVKLVSYGAEKPVMTGSTDADYQCNRRVDITYIR